MSTVFPTLMFLLLDSRMYSLAPLYLTQSISETKMHSAHKIEELTYAVSITDETTRMIPPPWVYELIRPLATNAQNKITGTRMRDNVRKIDLMSGPNTILPPQKNFCKVLQKVSTQTPVQVNCNHIP